MARPSYSWKLYAEGGQQHCCCRTDEKKTDFTDLTGFFFYRLTTHDKLCFLPWTRLSGLLTVSSRVSFERYRTNRYSFSKDCGGYWQKRLCAYLNYDHFVSAVAHKRYIANYSSTCQQTRPIPLRLVWCKSFTTVAEVTDRRPSVDIAGWKIIKLIVDDRRRPRYREKPVEPTFNFCHDFRSRPSGLFALVRRGAVPWTRHKSVSKCMDLKFRTRLTKRIIQFFHTRRRSDSRVSSNHKITRKRRL